LTSLEIAAVRGMLVGAFGPDEDDRFTNEDWEHAVGGVHFVIELDDEVIAHASVVERELHVDGGALRTGYVEAVATAPHRQGGGHGSRVMADVASYIRERFELGALATGRHRFYGRLGWLTWTGPSFVRTDDGTLPTPAMDGYILVLPTPLTPPLDLSADISCDWRPGDVW
jgi:aminoglycoside 2'-N-acetyltransferase I